MSARVKTARRRGYTKVSAKNQVTIPQDALVRAGLKVGDRLRAEAGRPGELILVREEDPVDRFAGALTGAFAPDQLNELRREWR
jgi:bifunctional DNA-binding transcriptional regulator/antitoxin component of YhaV-PrlF toxin-antitoxin module